MNIGVTWGVGLTVLASTMAVDAAKEPAPVVPPEGAPEYEAPPRPSDGANMALTVAKLEHGFDPARPLLIWAVGSSYTNFLGDGSLLIEELKPRFPNAPPIVYKKVVGNSTPFHFNRGWVRHLVVPDQPDVVLIYNFGKMEELEKLLTELRQYTTADIIMPTLHWCKPHASVWPDPEAAFGTQDPAALRAVCRKYDVEFVENRRELTEYLVKNNLPFEAFLIDAVHQSPYGAKMINRNIARHFRRPGKPAHDPRSRERRLGAASSAKVQRAGEWAVPGEGAGLRSAREGSALTVSFTGNRIDLIGWRAPAGGSAEVLIDDKPAGEAPVFYADYIKPNPQNAPAPPNPPRDRSPHRVTLGTNVVPQQWTIRMISDNADYELIGSVTGPDGKGNSGTLFTSTSGQVTIEPEFWRHPDTNRAGDTFTFQVVRCATARVDFKGESGKFRQTLVGNLPNGPHTLKLVVAGNGPVTVDAFDVFEPPLKGE